MELLFLILITHGYTCRFIPLLHLYFIDKSTFLVYALLSCDSPVQYIAGSCDLSTRLRETQKLHHVSHLKVAINDFWVESSFSHYEPKNLLCLVPTCAGVIAFLVGKAIATRFSKSCRETLCLYSSPLCSTN